MRMDLIQPFIGSLDTVLAEMMKEPAKIADLAMEEEGYRKKGLPPRSSCSRDRSKGASFSTWTRELPHRWRAFLLGGEDVDPAEADRSGSRVRAGEHGDRQRRHAAERPRLSIQGVSAARC